MSNLNRALIWAYNHGYVAREDGSVAGKTVDSMSLYTGGGKKGGRYLRFNVKPPWSKHKVHVKVHRLVAYQKYGEFWKSGLEVDHIDGDILNNSFDNIRVVTHTDNIRRAHSPLTEGDVDRIKKIASSGEWGIQSRLARKYGVAPSCIHGIVSGRNWK